MSADTIYKILTEEQWTQASAEGVLHGAPVDLADGFIHLSTAAQVRETAAKHFAGQQPLKLLSVSTQCLPAAALKWEISRGGALFPHLYAPLAIAWVHAVDTLVLAGGAHVFANTVPHTVQRLLSAGETPLIPADPRPAQPIT
ncbi:MAG: DUF952 domain-containing protein [Gammaproteobacteria bacterium]|nr:DUF952 domain-containing protein [Gammaproteobacteria bacterium]